LAIESLLKKPHAPKLKSENNAAGSHCDMLLPLI
jgi:hypothetical protein